VVSAERLRLDEADTGGVPWPRQQLCLALGLWNGRDPILKERLFGLTNTEDNHGGNVKFPYADLIAVNAARGKSDPEYELLDTGIFAGWYRCLLALP
jgi:hypothetical protein